MVKQLKEIITDPITGQAQLAQAKRMLEIMSQASAGTALITQLVTDSQVTESAKPMLSAISASVEIVIARPEATHNDKIAWIMAALLASYELGRMGDLGASNSKAGKH